MKILKKVSNHDHVFKRMTKLMANIIFIWVVHIILNIWSCKGYITKKSHSFKALLSSLFSFFLFSLLKYLCIYMMCCIYEHTCFVLNDVSSGFVSCYISFANIMVTKLGQHWKTIVSWKKRKKLAENFFDVFHVFDRNTTFYKKRIIGQPHVVVN